MFISSKDSKGKQVKAKQIPQGLDPRSYSVMPIDDLVIYAVQRIVGCGEDCTFERLVCQCFELFPEKFSFRRYPYWPDATRVNKSWLRCRTDKGWITGNVKTGFRLTSAGEVVASKVGKALSLREVPRATPTAEQGRERWESILQFVRQSEAFSRFKGAPSNFTMEEGEFRSLLSCTLETPVRVLRQNLKQVREAARVYHDSEISAFLRSCEKRMQAVLKRRPGAT